MKLEVISSETKAGQRVDTVVYTYTIGDDMIKLGQLYYNLGQKLNGASTGTEIAALQEMIKAQHKIVEGYGEINAANASAE